MKRINPLTLPFYNLNLDQYCLNIKKTMAIMATIAMMAAMVMMATMAIMAMMVTTAIAIRSFYIVAHKILNVLDSPPILWLYLSCLKSSGMALK